MMAQGSTQLIIRQQPARAQVVQENNPKNRKPIDPPPIIELKYDERHDLHNAQWLVSPRTFMMVTMHSEKDLEEQPGNKYLIGSTVSSLHRLKDINNKDGGFFVFGDISARKLGTYRLRFSLFDMGKDTAEVAFINSIDSDPFPVVPQRDFGSMSESTHLTRTFSDQGVKLRVRKDNRAISSIGNKRSYNASPPMSSSPSIHTGIYGGAVQDHYGHSAHSPVTKRHRSASEYDGSHLYQGGLNDTPLAPYGSMMSNGTRSYDNSRAYSQQHSPLSMPTLNRLQQPMSVQTPSWQGVHQQSALPSPTPSVSTQQHTGSYSSATSQQPSTLFGDPGAASSMSRNYYSNNSYSYQGHSSGEGQPAYSDLQMPGNSIPDTASIGSNNSQGYSQGYIPTTAGMFHSTEPGDVSPGYAPYLGDQKF